MAVTVPTSIESIAGFLSSLRTRISRQLAVERRNGAKSIIRAEDFNFPILMAHIARSRIPRNYSFYNPDGISTTDTSFMTVLQTKHTVSAATTSTLDLIARAGGGGQVRVTITDGSNTDTHTFTTTGSESTYSDTLDISGFFANAECTITVEMLASSGTETLYGLFIAPQNMTSSDLA
jgi:hypothetical protein